MNDLYNRIGRSIGKTDMLNAFMYAQLSKDNPGFNYLHPYEQERLNYSSKKFPHTMYYKQQPKEEMEWCRENFSSNHVKWNCNIRAICFRYEADAMAFKLRWS